MSEQITHLAIADDARRLSLASPRVGATVRSALEDHLEKYRLGALTRQTEQFAGPVIRRIRAEHGPAGGDSSDVRPLPPRQAEKLAFCLGSMAHRAADRMLKPVFTAQADPGRIERKDISIYHDVFCFDRLFARGRIGPYTPESLAPAEALPPAEEIDAAGFEEFFRVLFQRALLSAHTFKPDPADGDAWLDALFDRLQEMTIDLSRYHRALTEPDPEIVQRAIIQPNFYNQADSILSLADDLRAGRRVEGDQFLSRVRPGDDSSLYARALSNAYAYHHVTSDYWLGQVGQELFIDAIRR